MHLSFFYSIHLKSLQNSVIKSHVMCYSLHNYVFIIVFSANSIGNKGEGEASVDFIAKLIYFKSCLKSTWMMLLLMEEFISLKCRSKDVS